MRASRCSSANWWIRPAGSTCVRATCCSSDSVPPPERKERVTHVGISLGGKRFIHASTDVRINSLAPADTDYSQHREQMFLRAKRIIGAGPSTGVRHLKDLPYYGEAHE